MNTSHLKRYQLNKDILSNKRDKEKEFKIYAKKGDIVELLADHGFALMVNKVGSKEWFSICLNDIEKEV